MANGNPTAVRVGAGKLYFGVLGATEPTDLDSPWGTDWVPVGYTEEGHEMTIEPSFESIEVAEEQVPIDYRESRREMRLGFSSAELTAANIKKALNGGTITTDAGLGTSVGTVVLNATPNTIVTSGPHGLSVGDRFQLGAVSTTTGISANTTYYVKTVTNATTITASLTDGGAVLDFTTDGTAASLSQVVKLVYTFEPPAIGDVTYIAIGWESNDGLERWVYRKCIQVGSVAIARRKAPQKALIPLDFRIIVDMDESPFTAIIGESLV